MYYMCMYMYAFVIFIEHFIIISCIFTNEFEMFIACNVLT